MPSLNSLYNSPIQSRLPNSKGHLLTGDGTENVVLLSSSVNKQVLTINTAEDKGLVWDDPQSIVLTTKGDLLTRSSLAEARVPVGLDGQILLADSVNSNGLSWQNWAVVNREVLTADLQLLSTSKRYQHLNPNGSNRNVILPAVPSNGLQFFIFNLDAFNYDLTVRESVGGTVVEVLNAGTQRAEFLFDSVEWVSIG